MKSIKKAIISGITGQDGFYLSRQLLNFGYDVVGITRFENNFKTKDLDDRIEIVTSDYSKKSLKKIIESVRPDEIYHLAGQTYVGKSWMIVDETIEASALITIKFLELITEIDKKIKFFNASSAEIYADSFEQLSEFSLKEPTTPYGCAKLFAHNMTKSFRDNYDLFAVNGILFNHESVRRQNDFFSKKLVKGVVDIHTKVAKNIKLGNLDVIRDWGSAEEYMLVLPVIMSLDKPSDYNICFSKGKSVRELVQYVFSLFQLDYINFVEIDQKLIRNKEKHRVVGSNDYLQATTGWKPCKTIENVFLEMVQQELKERGLSELL